MDENDPTDTTVTTMEAIAEQDELSSAAAADLRPSIQEESKALSHVSRHYDIGGKGFLTPAEQKARELDHKGEGNLSNEQVVGLIERTEDLKKANKMLRRYMIALLLVTVALGISQIATAIVAARLSKDTSVSSSTGLMTVKDSDKTVVVVATGSTTVINVNSETKQACVRLEDFGKMLTETAQGVATNAVLRTSNTSMASVSFQSASTNETHACLTGEDGSLTCTEYEPCEEDELDGSRRRQRRSLEEQSKGRRLAHQSIQRHLARKLNFGGFGDFGGGGGGSSCDGCGGDQHTPCCIQIVDFGDEF